MASGAVTVGDIRWRLRRDTAAQHRALEHLVPVMRPNLTLGDYRDWLWRLLGFYQPLEACLGEQAVRLLPDWPRRVKSDWLLADLRHLGLVARDLETTAARCPALPAFRDDAGTLGVIYVLEGATLGGQVIHRHLHQRLGVGPSSGGRFYAGYGTRSGERWQAFQTVLRAQVVSESEMATAVTAATATFRCFSDWISA